MPVHTQLLIRPERDVARDDDASDFDIVVEIRSQSPGQVPTTSSKALNLAVVIDRSGSMKGEKIGAAKKSCIDILSRLGQEDLLTVVTFDDEARVVADPQMSRAEAKTRIEAIDSDGQTNLSLGWYLGLSELQTHGTSDHNSRLFLLSDGQANAGETKRLTLAKEAARSRDLGITTSTIGIGEGFQEDLLEAIATESGGRFWYIQESRIDDIIAEEFQGALSVAIDRPRVELVLPPGVTIGRELNTLSKVNGRYRARPIKGDDTFNFAIRLNVTPTAISDRTIAIAARLFDGEQRIADTELKVPLVPPQQYVTSQPNPLVASVVQQFESTISNEKMIDDLGADGLDLMRKMLVREVDGMRVVRDALASQHASHLESERWIMELGHLSADMALKEVSLIIADVVANPELSNAPEVESFIQRWRKILRMGQHRIHQREHRVTPADDDLERDLNASGLALLETLRQRYPAQAGPLTLAIENLNARLARHQR
jgi:Ca-activated chloride channel homolog